MTQTSELNTQPAIADSSAIPADFLTASQLARRLGVGKTAIYEWLAKGDISYHRIGRLIRVRESDVADFIHRNRVEHVPRRKYGRYTQA